MERVIMINLNGNAYQLEEPACDAVRAYLKRAEASLAANPDKAEILGDLEQAIADKCAAYLSRVKTVVSAADMSKALEEMGAVDGEESADATSDSAAPAAGSAPPKKRLYRLPEAAQLAGVCAGLGAYFDINARIVRMLFLFATLVTWGLFALVYIGLMFWMPSAQTNEEWAAAHGVPYNAQDVIDRAKRDQGFNDDNAWRWSRRWRRFRRDLRDRWRDRGPWRGYDAYAAQAPPPPAGPVSAVFDGIVAVVFGLAHVIVTIVFLCLLFMLITTGSIGDWRFSDTGAWHMTRLSDNTFVWPAIELWPALIVLLIVFSVIGRALRRVAYGPRYPYGYYRAGESFITLIALVLFAWFAWAYIPEARHIMENIPEALRQFGAQLRDAIDQAARENAEPWR